MKEKFNITPFKKQKYDGSMTQITPYISVGIINTILNVKHRDVLKEFNMVIIDECHILGAETFSKILQYTSEYQLVLGLSATPTRYDKFEKMYYQYFEKQLILDIVDIEKFVVNHIFYRDLDHSIYEEQVKMTASNMLKKLIQIFSIISDMQKRDELIMKITMSILDDPNSTLLVVCPRIK